ncbi:MFS transporter [Novosphingobium sp.]|uniref:MFS transporter n=1 Tax=Novosphingobium sp. TaxID=1874826 RepID=UPI0031CEFEFF
MVRTRHLLLAVTFSLTTLLYVDRIAVSAAKAAIVGDLGLSDTSFGWVLSAFALGYALCQAPAGAIADRFGARGVLAGIVVLWSAFTGLTGLAMGLGSLLLIRFLFGAAEAGAFPTCARAIYAWLPAGERALAQGINLSGSRLGAAFALPLVASLLGHAGWRASFFVLGAVGVVWAAAWYAWFRNTPEEHSGVTPAELAEIRGDPQARPDPREATVPHGSLWCSASMWLLMGQFFASNFTFFFCLTWLFPYLQKAYHLDALTTGMLAAVPLVAGALGNWVSGWTIDRLFRRGFAMQSRRWVAMVGFALSAVGLLGCLTATTAGGATAWLALAVFGADLTNPASWATCIDLGGPRSGAVSGVMNMAGNLGSFMTGLAFPYLMAAFGSATPFFTLGAVLNLLAMLCWVALRIRRGVVFDRP